MTSELALAVAFGLGAGSLALALLLVAGVAALRWRGLRRRARQATLALTWQPLLALAALGDPLPAPLPAIAPRDRVAWARLWLQLQDALRGEAHARLQALARRVGLHEDARRWAGGTGGRRGAGRPGDTRALGFALLGHLHDAHDPAGLPLLHAGLDDPDPDVGLAAARALLRADPAAHGAAVLERFVARPDWPLAGFGALLRDTGVHALAPTLAARLSAAGVAERRRLLPLMRLLETPHAQSVVARVAHETDDAQTLSIALRQLHDPGSAPRVRALAGHADALVRSAAAQALGQVGQADDAARLAALMADPDWWVRRRAAESLLRLPGLDAAALATWQGRLTDRYAVDALVQAQADRRLRLAAAPEAGR